MEYKKTTCPLDCPDTCGMVATVENGRITSLRGDTDHPYTKGVICRKMREYHKRVYSDDRILYPMKRSGKKGEGKFERISWDAAYSILTEKINEVVKNYGGEAILPFVYAGNMGAVNRFAGYPLLNKLGTSWLEETICSAAAKAGWRSHCGDVPGSPPEVAENAELILIWGSNTKVTNMHFWPYVAAARKKGAKLVVIDPYRNVTAASADLHLKIRPGEDSTLALWLIKILIDKQCVDHTFLEKYTTGFEVLEKYLETTPSKSFFDRCGISEDDVTSFVDMLVDSEKIFLRIGIGMTRNSKAGMSIRAITSLAAALGLFDGRDGRGVLLSSGAFKGDQQKLTWSSLAEKKTRKFNMVQLGNCLTTASPPVKMFFVYNANPLSVVPDGSLVRQALGKDDIFTVVHEQVMTPTAKYADLLLPATTFLENKDLYTAYGHFYMAIAEPVIEPCGEAKSNFTFFQELANRLGYTDPPFKQSLEDRLIDYLKTLDGPPESFDPQNYPAGKAVLSKRACSSQNIFSKDRLYNFVQEEDRLLPQCACLIAPNEFDDADYISRFPLQLITPPHMDLLNSTFGERYEGNTGEVLIHPEDSKKYEVDDGETVTLYNNRGWNRRIARVTDATQKGLLVAEGIFWQSKMNLSGINDLTSQKLTDMGGGGTYHESRVAVLVNNKK